MVETSYPIITARAVILAMGAKHRRLGLPGDDLPGVFYAATDKEAPLCDSMQAVVVGGGNSAGQAAMFLAGVRRCCIWSDQYRILIPAPAYFLCLPFDGEFPWFPFVSSDSRA